MKTLIDGIQDFEGFFNLAYQAVDLLLGTFEIVASSPLDQHYQEGNEEDIFFNLSMFHSQTEVNNVFEETLPIRDLWMK